MKNIYADPQLQKTPPVGGATALFRASSAPAAATSDHRVIKTEPLSNAHMKAVTEEEWTATLKRIEAIEAQMVYLEPLAEMRRKARETAAEKSKRKMEERLQTLRATESIRRKLEQEQGLMEGAKPRIPKQANVRGERVRR